MTDFESNKRIDQWTNKKNEILNWLSENGYNLPTISKKKIDKFFSIRDLELKDLKVAAIMDKFTLESYKPECNLLELTPANWKTEMQSFNPDLLFIESAWKGKDELWYRKIDRYSDEVKALTTYCHNMNIPVIFWNKEDPVYTNSFMITASYADVVFTTDIDCISRYKTELGHDKVYHLHFAAQPQLHNPIEKYDRQDKFCFAGAYYHRYKDRSKVFDDFAERFMETKGLDIYDRNYPSPLPEHAFPAKYNKYILGSLPSREIDKAYKGYVYGINMNSISQSQTMFARRVFEMLASNTITVGNYSRGLKNYFGDLTVCTNDKKTLSLYLDKYTSTPEMYRKYRLLGLRKVLLGHLYEDRLNYICEKVYGKTLKKKQPNVTVYTKANNPHEVERVKKMFNNQTYKNKKLVFIENDKVCLTKEANEFVTFFKPGDWYGENYLLDLMLTLRYYNANAIGKDYYYKNSNSQIIKSEGLSYTEVKSLMLCRAVVCANLIQEENLQADYSITGNNIFSVDEFNYCENHCEDNCEEASDLFIADQGLEISAIERIAEEIQSSDLEEGVSRISGRELAKAPLSDTIPVKFIENGNKMIVESNLDEGKHEYIYISKTRFNVAPYVDDGKMSIYFKGSGKLDLICVVLCFDANGEKLKPLYPKLNIREELTLPEGTIDCEIGFRPKGKGTAEIEEIIIGGSAEKQEKNNLLFRSNVLVLSNHYPSSDNLYRNMFVHKRMTSYKDGGYAYDIMRMHPQATECYREFEGINVIETGGYQLINALESGNISTVCVHFLDKAMWEILKNYLADIQLLIWQHGSEVQPWWRREYNFADEKELEEGKKASDERMKLWKEVFDASKNHKNIKFVYVSQYFADEVMGDYGVEIPKSQYYIIHNIIDTDLFSYKEKDAELRKKIVTIKPFASRKYANDLTTNAIVELSKYPCFKDLEINIYGQGVYFGKDNKPLKKYPNVHLHEEFLTQAEIKKVHDENGIFIATTRMDAQGVSRGEAMSSGLVAIANNCTAIPEFVDDDCGVLVPAESYKEIAEAINHLYENPELFCTLSINSANRIRNQLSKEYTIDKEIRLIGGDEI